MVTLNDYLYSGDTVFKDSAQIYRRILRREAKDEPAMRLIWSTAISCSRFAELLEHNDFLTAQSQKIREFYKYMAQEYPFLAFTFKGRIKSLLRAEEKFNGYIVECVYELLPGKWSAIRPCV